MELPDSKTELVALGDERVAVWPGECLSCYLDRAIPLAGCSNGLDLSKKWNDAQQPKVPRLEEWLETRGGHCDCEAVMNVLYSSIRPGGDKRLWCINAFSSYIATFDDAEE